MTARWPRSWAASRPAPSSRPAWRAAGRREGHRGPPGLPRRYDSARARGQSAHAGPRTLAGPVEPLGIRHSVLPRARPIGSDGYVRQPESMIMCLSTQTDATCPIRQDSGSSALDQGRDGPIRGTVVGLCPQRLSPGSQAQAGCRRTGRALSLRDILHNDRVHLRSSELHLLVVPLLGGASDPVAIAESGAVRMAGHAAAGVAGTVGSARDRRRRHTPRSTSRVVA